MSCSKARSSQIESFITNSLVILYFQQECDHVPMVIITFCSNSEIDNAGCGQPVQYGKIACLTLQSVTGSIPCTLQASTAHAAMHYKIAKSIPIQGVKFKE